MYPNSNSSSSASHPSRDPNNNNNNNIIDNVNNNNNNGGIGLARYRSAPVSFLNNAVDSVIINGQSGHQQQQPQHNNNNNNTGNHMMGVGGMPTRFFSPAPPHTTTSSQVSTSVDDDRLQKTTPFRLNEFATAFNGLKATTQQTPSPLFRHGSSPAGFLNTLVSSTTPSEAGRGSRLSSQLSFTGTSSCFSQISEESDIVNSLVFSSSSPHNKRAKTNTTNGLNITETELNFGLSESALEAATTEKMMDLPHDSVPCKIRAKRGCATHPRSIAERERRTRISGKLKKLQDLVPNMDKQTSYSDMLDLAVQHIKGLQTHVQSLREELQSCSCGCKPN